MKSFLSQATLILIIFFLSGCVKRLEHLDVIREANIQQDLYIIADDDLLSGSRLTFDNVVAIALQRNFDLLLKQREYCIQFETATRDRLRMLPGIILNGELSGRNRPLILSSESVVPGIPPAPPSISTEQNIDRNDASIVWNLLDLGVSYVRARQEINRGLILEFEYERIRQNLIVDLSKNFWVAIASKNAIERGRKILALAQKHFKNLEAEIAEKIISKVKGLRNQVDIVTLQIQIEGFKKDYHTAMSALALTMGLSPCVEFELIYDEKRPVALELDDICLLEEVALKNRPELFARDVEEKITEDEVRTAFLRMIPGMEVFAGTYYDANRFLTFNHWLSAGARATWNLFLIPQLYADSKIARNRIELIKAQRMALSVAILSQVRLAYLLYQDNRAQYLLVHELENVSQSLLSAAKEEYESGIMSEEELLLYDSQALIAEVNAMRAYGDLQVNLEQLNSAIGLPRFYNILGEESCEFN